MDCKLFIETYKRMCHSVDDCVECSLYVNEKDGCAMDGYKEDGYKDEFSPVEKIIEAVEIWYTEHLPKTRLNEAKKLFVNLPLTEDGKYPTIDPCQVDCKIHRECMTNKFFGNCEKCRNEYWNKELDDN